MDNMIAQIAMDNPAAEQNAIAAREAEDQIVKMERPRPTYYMSGNKSQCGMRVRTDNGAEYLVNEQGNLVRTNKELSKKAKRVLVRKQRRLRK